MRGLVRVVVLAVALAHSVVAPAVQAAERPLKKVQVVFAAGIIDSQVSMWTAAEALGYYKEDGLTVDFSAVRGTAAAIQTLLSGQAQFAVVNAASLLLPASRGQDVGVMGVYNWMRKNHVRFAVKPDSPITELAQLKGKKIGITTMADTGNQAGIPALKLVGLDPEKDLTRIVVGYGGSAATALAGGSVDALAIWDVEFGRMENLGFKFRYLPIPPPIVNIFGATLAATRDFAKQDPQAVLGVGRGTAKGFLFAFNNPEAAIRLHWRLYPETKPKGKTEEEALREQLFLVKLRLPLYRFDDLADRRWGPYTREEWQTWARILGVEDKVKDLDALYTNAAVEEINRFDPRKIEADARAAGR
jgi:NitT/TauT family transport system substrate-binding protein